VRGTNHTVVQVRERETVFYSHAGICCRMVCYSSCRHYVQLEFVSI